LRVLPDAQFAFPLPFQIDHILAEKHGGETVESNLALSCPHCNRFKGPNIAGVDPATAQLTRLFDPRRDN
jgi:5-methylcytosine-specific restriction endonuclease McrA